ncbi:hypothetical protein LTR56_012003 [Elasticomyces elasticus]|nr:hypothetical protein LTR22_018102 [Elasticomyces elasticus]KAK3640207.1 hypothetical protein LTR56_012003 [Elasticomyces elasticus]KAK4913276.1 hypothetical protein LTR49_018349 [Elasticomyces elasticus]KAK5751358.1 hypothetical protein LTS12_018596 [Elasticomyces elasticus]
MSADEEVDQSSLHTMNPKPQRRNSEESISEISTKSNSLRQDHEDLKAKYEQAQLDRDYYKELAHDMQGGPFVVLLVDGNEYMFNDELMRDSISGGQRAVIRLEEVLKASMKDLGLRNCSIVVRVFANHGALSRNLEKKGTRTAGGKIVGPFASKFTDTNDLFDFIFTSHISAMPKLLTSLRHFMDIPQCKHLYFAGCHDRSYVADLTPHRSSSRITLVDHTSFKTEFAELDMRVEELRDIFCPISRTPNTKSIGAQVKTSTRHDNLNLEIPSRSFFKQSRSAARTEPRGLICKYFQAGACKSGRACNFRHVKLPINSSNRAIEPVHHDSLAWQHIMQSSPMSSRNASAERDTSSSHSHRSVASTVHTSGSHSAGSSDGYFAARLPASVPAGKVAVNDSGHRLDIQAPFVSQKDDTDYKDRTAKKSLCNTFYLSGRCIRTNCGFDHSPVTEAVLNAHKRNMSRFPCRRGGACRRLGCANAHICQQTACVCRGGNRYCKFTTEIHMQELTVTKFVDGSGGDRTARYSTRVVEEGGDKRGDTPTAQLDGVEDEEDLLLDLGGDEAVSASTKTPSVNTQYADLGSEAVMIDSNDLPVPSYAETEDERLERETVQQEAAEDEERARADAYRCHSASWK